MWETVLTDVAKILLPGLLVVAVAYVVFRAMEKQWNARDRSAQRMAAFEQLLPMRISAYERLTLFMERIQPTGLVARCSPNEHTAQQLKIVLMREIGEEFEHNVVQQIYLSDAAWRAIMAAKSEIVELIVSSAGQLPPNASGLQLAERITNRLNEDGLEFSKPAFALLRDDVFRLFPNR